MQSAPIHVTVCWQVLAGATAIWGPRQDAPDRALLALMREIRQLLKDPRVRVTDVAKRYGVSRSTIYKHAGTVVPEREVIA
ncbi:MAG: helix-turn-helix domain-containing protein [Acidithiobacillus sp.]